MATVLRAPNPVLQFFNNSGLPNVNGTVLTQVGGVNYATYQDAAGTTALPNPIPLNSRGEVSNASGISSELWLVQGVTYTFTLFNASGNQIGQYPNISGGLDSGTGGSLSGTNAFTGSNSFIDSNLSILNNADNTKVIKFLGSGLPTGTTAILNVAAANVVEGVLGSSIASAPTLVLDTATGDYSHVTGTTAVTAITLAPGRCRTVVFDAALTLTNGALLILPGAANIVTAAGDTAIFRGEAAGVRCVAYTRASPGALPPGFGLSAMTASLGADVALNNTANYFDGPSIAQGTLGTWFVSGSIVVGASAASHIFLIKLWDGTNIVASASVVGGTIPTTYITQVTLSGYIASPAGNLRMSVRDVTATTGQIYFNQSGFSKDSTITAIRVA